MIIAAALATLLACKDDNHITLDGSTDVFPEGCHFDCTSQIQCRAGVAYQRDPAPIPCEAWTGSCAGVAHACTAGCDLEFWATRLANDYATSLDAFCSETPVAQVGDTCARGCLPTRAVADAQGNVTQQYLRCDANQCAIAAPATVESYLAPCGVGGDLAGPDVTGIASDGGDRVCLIAWDATSSTSRKGSSVHCVGDWECPDGSSCDDSLPLVDHSGGSTAVCRPGARGSALFARLPP
ncbi:MAG TPA: hypothetical protein VIV40_04295 [Kofleriaceae bacterium]